MLPVTKNLTDNTKSGGECSTIILAEVKALDQRITNARPMTTDFRVALVRIMLVHFSCAYGALKARF